MNESIQTHLLSSQMRIEEWFTQGQPATDKATHLLPAHADTKLYSLVAEANLKNMQFKNMEKSKFEHQTKWYLVM